MPARREVRLTFAIAKRFDRAAQREVSEEIEDHVRGFLGLVAADGTVCVECESDRSMAFVHITRDLESFTKDELGMLTALLAQRFGDTLVRNPDVDEHPDEDPAAREDLVEYAIETLRDPEQSKNLVGFREEKRVLVYFLKARKKAKASARR